MAQLYILMIKMQSERGSEGDNYNYRSVSASPLSMRCAVPFSGIEVG